MPTNVISANENYSNYGCEICKKIVKNMKIILELSIFENMPNYKLK